MTNSALWDDTPYVSPPPPPDGRTYHDDILGLMALACVALMVIAWFLTQMGIW